MTINNAQNYVNSLWDWGVLDGCFGSSRIKASDIDGIVERNLWFLVLETKLPTVSALPFGQAITMKQLIETGYFTELVIYGHPGKPERLELTTRHHVISHYVIADLSLIILRDIVSSWYSFADAHYTHPSPGTPTRQPCGKYGF